jgi:hypothetical protein
MAGIGSATGAESEDASSTSSTMDDQAMASVTPHVSKPHDYVNHMFMRP